MSPGMLRRDISRRFIIIIIIIIIIIKSTEQSQLAVEIGSKFNPTVTTPACISIYKMVHVFVRL